jgi:hypothetical protein
MNGNTMWQIDVQRVDAEQIQEGRVTCKCCLRRKRFEYHVKDLDWNVAIPKELALYDLCIECFLRFCDIKGINPTFTNPLNKEHLDYHENRKYTQEIICRCSLK